MKRFGFSTGALAKGDFQRALKHSLAAQDAAVEYSALREQELRPLAEFLLEHGKGPFGHVSFHAPSQFSPENEARIVDLLNVLVQKLDVWIVAHPDSIKNFHLWRNLGARLCIENMDHRKPIGRSAEELEKVFSELPEAKLCFDIGHAHEIDRSMSIAYEIVKRFRDRIIQVHASEVSDTCEHRAFTASSEAAFSRVASLIPENAAVILETVVPTEEASEQMQKARQIFGDLPSGERRLNHSRSSSETLVTT
jgi:Xylose isomerase-like TIM barrel